MRFDSQLEYEAAGIVLLIAAGVATAVVTALVSPLFPWLNGSLVFVLLIAAVLGATVLVERSNEEERTTVDERSNEGGVIGVDLLDWANDRVGKPCLGCENEITYIPLGTTGGQRNHRIECGCTVIELRTKD